MNRSRRLIVSAGAVVGVGLLLAFSARLGTTARAAVGPVPAEALALPASSVMVMGFDVRSTTSSDFYSKFGGTGEPGHIEALSKIEKHTGLNPERDIDSVVVAIQAPSSKGEGANAKRDDNALIFVTGRFDANRLAQAHPEAGKLTPERRGDVTLYRAPKGNEAVALLDAGVLVAGDIGGIEAFLANRQSGRGLADNKELVSLLERVEPGSTWWAVGGASVLSRIASQAGAAGGPMGQLPAVKQIVAYGHLDPEVGLSATAEAADAKSATKIADVLRGFSAMLSLQAGQKAELAQIADSISVATEDDKVHIKASISHELLESLKKATEKEHGPRKAAEDLAAAIQ